jgi:hypothetical protein
MCVDRIGQNSGRLVSQLCVPHAIEQVDHVLPAELLHWPSLTGYRPMHERAFAGQQSGRDG